jgi:hypothetical protein
MPESKTIRKSGNALRGRLYQSLALVFCVLFGMAMIANTQLGGEALWFWYATFLRNGTRLFTDLHLALPPLFALENAGWMQMFGTRTLVTEIPSVIHAFVLSLAIFLILQESDWPDWQKAIVLAGNFLLCVYIGAYRFDDFHVLADIFILFSLLTLLWIARAETVAQAFRLAGALGILSGLAITTRLNDGVALVVAVMLCLFFLARKQKILAAGLFLAATLLTIVVVVRLTGDTLSAYVSNGIVGAAASKGVDKTSILQRPWSMFFNALHLVRTGGKWLLLWTCAIIVTGAALARYWQKGIKYIVPLQLGIAAAGFVYSSHALRQQLLAGTFVNVLSIALIVVNYLVALLVVVRYLNSTMALGKREWDAREILVFVPLAELASASASTGGQPTNGFLFSQIAMLLLLVPVVQPFRRHSSWANPSFVTIVALLGLSCFAAKIQDPYSWNNFSSSPMFVNRQWYRHPVYGPMYLDRDLLHFIQPICEKIDQGNPSPELLSLPFAYPNYFCATPPWHGYVQTYFDTSQRSTILQLMNELDTAPPQWILYQRQLKILEGAEKNYNHGQPLAHRDLDTMIMQKIATGQWRLVDKVNYLEGDGWLLIKTRP